MNINTRGFTLMELLVVIAIIGILASVIIASLGDAREKGRDARRARDMQEVRKAIELYYHDNGQYPPTPSGALVANMTTLSPYIDPIPTDPDNTGAFQYLYRVGNGGTAAQNVQSYSIRLRLEKDTDYCHLSGVALEYTGVVAGYTTYEGYQDCAF